MLKAMKDTPLIALARSRLEHEPGDKECLIAVWSVGRACKKCRANCYRQGWSKLAVDRDNLRLVRERALTQSELT